MLENNIKYSYNDITLVPSILSEISHRHECVTHLSNGKLPIFTAPMSTVVDDKNFELFENNGINAILPRNINIKTRIDFVKKSKWVAFSLNEFNDIFNNADNLNMWNDSKKLFVLVDIANGHMVKLYDSVRQVKSLLKDKISIMVGNIANPETYLAVYESGADYVRLGIGGGSGCFVRGTKVTMGDGSIKNIEDVLVGDVVKTLTGNKNVLSTKEIESDKKICINGDIECTPNHKFLVINKKDIDKVNDDNLMNYAFYLEANALNPHEHLLVKNV